MSEVQEDSRVLSQPKENSAAGATLFNESYGNFLSRLSQDVSKSTGGAMAQFTDAKDLLWTPDRSNEQEKLHTADRQTQQLNKYEFGSREQAPFPHVKEVEIAPLPQKKH